ncbi:MAG: glycogen debranching enzyme, partial [Anaerolineales bacterium]|nr:glycogen debranching enzyme [Anaerolineales bacterium]
VRLNRPDWSDDSHSLAFTLHDYPGDVDIHVIVNAYWESLDFELPEPPQGMGWHQAVDTHLASPADLPDEGSRSAVTAAHYRVAPRCVVILVASTS